MGQKLKIAYISKFSNEYVRANLSLSNNKFRNFVFGIFKRPRITYGDIYLWNTDFIIEFEKHQEHEFHVISAHNGMQKRFQNFEKEGIHYHFFKCNSNIFIDSVRSWLHYDEKTVYKRHRKRIKLILQNVNPDVVVICGAEQPQYSPCILDIYNKPVFVLLQSLVNDPDLINVLPGSRIYCDVESKSFKAVQYFGTGNSKYYNLFRKFNDSAQCLQVSFPTHQPVITDNSEKQFDFIFFAAMVTQNKGIEDVIKAFNLVRQEVPTSTLSICGRCQDAYKQYLISLLSVDALSGVTFAGFFDSIDNSNKYVQTGRIVVIPGITAPLNGTVREAMLMGLPTIVYETIVTRGINAEKQCLLTAEMENVNDLASKMIFSLRNPDAMAVIASNGFEYARINYSNEPVVNTLLQDAVAVYDHYTKGVAIPKELMYIP